MNSDERIRLFLGVRVSMETLEALRTTADDLCTELEPTGARIRWVEPASYHVTIKFLGWARAAVIDAIRDRVAAELAGLASFSFRCRGLGAFPTPDRARVIWAGIDRGEAALAELAERVERAVVPLGFEREKRAFHPHVTLGRCRAGADLAAALGKQSERVFSETAATSLILFESVLKPTGSEYRVVAQWDFELSSKGSERHTEPLKPGESEPQTQEEGAPEGAEFDADSAGVDSEEQEHGKGEQQESD